MRKYEEVVGNINRNVKDILSGQTSDIGLKRANGCLLAILCEMLLDIRESLSKGTIVPSCEVVDQ